jgi:hypothetical protein
VGIGVMLAHRGGGDTPSAPPPPNAPVTAAAAPAFPKSADATPAAARVERSAAGAAAKDPQNVLVNGSMEESDTVDGVAGWSIHTKFKQQVQLRTEDGNRFLRLINDDPTKFVFVDQKVKIDPSWKAVTVSARMRTKNFISGKGSAQDARVAVAFRDVNDERIGKWPPVPEVREESPTWVTRTATADVPPGAAFIYIQCAISNSKGTVDFDDVKVIPQK